MRVNLGNAIAIDISEKWRDISSTVPGPAFATLGLENGVGVIQFSIAMFSSGELPKVEIEDILSISQEFAVRHGLNINPVRLDDARSECVGGVGYSSDETVGVWHLTDGKNILLVTYTSLKPKDQNTIEELSQAIQVV